jgi:Tol biopolymer transport system component
VSKRIVVAIGLVVSGCGDVVKHLADAPPLDDSKPQDGGIDAPPPRCDPAKAFGAPVSITELNSGGDDSGLTLSGDELTAVFASSRAGGVGGQDLYVSQRATRTAPWGAPSLLAGVNTTAQEGRPSLSGDGLTLYAEFLLNANSTYDIVRATRASTANAFGALSVVGVINGTATDAQPWVLPDNSAVYFESTRGVNGDGDIYVASGAAGSFAAPTLVTGTSLQTTSTEGYPVVTQDQLDLYFRSDRAGAGSFDIWLATRTSVAAGFSAPVNVSLLNTNVAEAPTWVSADNCVLYFMRNIGTVASNTDLYVATKPL